MLSAAVSWLHLDRKPRHLPHTRTNRGSVSSKALMSLGCHLLHLVPYPMWCFLENHGKKWPKRTFWSTMFRREERLSLTHEYTIYFINICTHFSFKFTMQNPLGCSPSLEPQLPFLLECLLCSINICLNCLCFSRNSFLREDENWEVPTAIKALNYHAGPHQDKEMAPRPGLDNFLPLRSSETRAQLSFTFHWLLTVAWSSFFSLSFPYFSLSLYLLPQKHSGK